MGIFYEGCGRGPLGVKCICSNTGTIPLVHLPRVCCVMTRYTSSTSRDTSTLGAMHFTHNVSCDSRVVAAKCSSLSMTSGRGGGRAGHVGRVVGRCEGRCFTRNRLFCFLGTRGCDACCNYKVRAVARTRCRVALPSSRCVFKGGSG